jgi:hypothetical protein
LYIYIARLVCASLKLLLEKLEISFVSMSYPASKLAVRDSFEDEDASDDVEDEVFIRDGRNGFKVDEERGVKRPLMAPRRKSKSSHFHGDIGRRPSCRALCAPCCYGFLALSALLGL